MIEFVAHNFIVTGIMLGIALLGVVVAVAGRFTKDRVGSRIAAALALFLGLACVGVGMLQSAALHAAATSARATPGLSRADRERIVTRDSDDADASIAVALVIAFVPTAAALEAIRRASRERREKGAP